MCTIFYIPISFLGGSIIQFVDKTMVVCDLACPTIVSSNVGRNICMYKSWKIFQRNRVNINFVSIYLWDPHTKGNTLSCRSTAISSLLHMKYDS